jgi:hypothetical protein
LTNTPAAPATRRSHQRTAPTPQQFCENPTRSNLPPRGPKTPISTNS